MKKLYLEYNLFAYLLDRRMPELDEALRSLEGTWCFPYSPAHMEEVASGTADAVRKGIERSVHNALLVKKLTMISRLSGNLELVPTKDGPIAERFEDPIHCLQRVANFYEVNGFVESIETRTLEGFREAAPDSAVSNVASNLPEDFLLQPEYEPEIRRKLYENLLIREMMTRLGIEELKWPRLLESHALLQDVISLSMNHLEEIRFRPESVNKSRSRIHDVSHAIYATACDAFVTNDGKLLAKMKAIYRYFGIPTRLLGLKDFLAGGLE